MIRTLAAALATSTCIVALATPAAAQTREYNIPAGSLKSALDAYVRQSGRQVVYRADQVRSARSLGTRGQQSAEAALAAILAGSGFTTRIDGNLVAIVREGNGQTAGDETALTGEDFSTSIAEIIVTAQKREERLQDVPIPVSVVAAEKLIQNNQLRLEDYYRQIPGLSLTMLGDVGSPLIAIRGITPGGYVTPTVGTVLDDIPIGSSTSLGNGVLAPDLDPSELARIEVLRGPQGTLYGANSLGGLIKYITAAPSTDKLSGRLQVGGTAVRGGSDLGYNVRGSVNVPLLDTFAIRASATHRVEPGYIDNLATGERDVNRSEATNFRIATLWRPSSDLTIQLSALHQDVRRDGSPDVHVLSGLGDLQQRAVRNTGWYDQRIDAFGATVVAQVGNAELTSLSGYSVNKFASLVDLTPSTFLANVTQTRFGVSGIGTNANLKTKKFSQELRVAVPLSDNIDFLGGGFYTRESYSSRTDILPIDPATGRSVGLWLRTLAGGGYDEYAIFGNVTFKFSDRFDVQVGGRYTANKFDVDEQTATGPFPSATGPSVTTVTPAFQSKDQPFTYLLTPRFRVSDELMIYARLASGYRPGGPNLNTAAITAGYPASYDADTTRTYEVGLKGELASGVIKYDLSAYYIDWRDVQLQVRDPNNAALQYTINGGSAESKGIEFSLDVKPWRGFVVSGWVAYNEAQLSQVPANLVITARAGDRLPYSPKWSGNVSVEQSFPLGSIGDAFVGGTLSYVDDRKGRFFTGVPQETFPEYTQIDLRAGLNIGGWEIAAYLNNLTDKRGVLRSGRDTPFSFGFARTHTQPRTFGLSVAREF
ncbi:TonB-dependent receptor [Sphingobium sp. Sx8-8]|uniref:TonB-dependent receptor n=1 Tax=Sphingobium sp. Sx8-8 TaxID=2933617 RepID=UPI001F58FA11|nr:TonB-dependent receptor [Sphingobium sp. Sx8-8]